MMTKRDKSAENRISPKQSQAAVLLADPTFTGTITDMCDKIGISRQTFYRWMSTSDFRSYVDGLISIYTDAELSKAWKALMKLVDRGDIQAIKLFFELKGKYKTGVAISGNDKLDSLIDAIREVN